MSSMFEMFETDASAEQKGIVLDYGDFRVTVARAGGANKAYERCLERITKKYRRAIQTENLPNEKANELLMVAYSQEVVRDWEVNKGTDAAPEWISGIPQRGSDELLTVTPENVLATFKALPDLFDAIKDDAQKGVLFRAALREEAAGN